jgi:tetratricopeptide (TPR) repeat protein
VKDEPLIVAIYRHYARGEAYAARRDAAAVKREAEAIAALLAQPAPPGAAGGDAEIGQIARDVLQGRAEMVAGRPDAAVPFFERAAAAQEKAYPVVRFFDPPPWWYPVRRSLAAAHLAAGRRDEAARVARQSLAEWPHDGLALRVLAEATGKRRDRTAARNAWRGPLNAVPLDLT